MKRNEHRIFQIALNALASKSVQAGCKNSGVIRRPDLLIEGMVRDGILPEVSVIGRWGLLDVPTFQRTALAVDIRYLAEHEEAILNWIEDNSSVDPQEAFNVLCYGSLVGATLGVNGCVSEALDKVIKLLASAPSLQDRMAFARNLRPLLGLPSADGY